MHVFMPCLINWNISLSNILIRTILYICIFFLGHFVYSIAFLQVRSIDMAMSKGMVLCLCVIMLCGLFVKDTNATVISNGAMVKNRAAPCSRLHPQDCVTPPANEYQRGCEKEERCRGGKRPKPRPKPRLDPKTWFNTETNYEERLLILFDKADSN
jgi:hypothetical protein